MAVLQAELYDDVESRSRADSRPWVPIPPDSDKSPYQVGDPSGQAACFSVVELEGESLAGEALLWGIDLHNRKAHIGLALRPVCRGRGYGVDALEVLCRYGFRIRGLNRLQAETLSSNTPMIKAARRVGFSVEGTTRSSAWAAGAFVDEVILGLLADEWDHSSR